MTPWDYLIVTASNEAQAEAYRAHLDLRRELGLLAGVRDVLVVPDPDGRRVGSGGSTLCCLIEVLNREMARDGRRQPGGSDLPADARCRSILQSLRILIVHAGGDSRRLPAYGACGKLFIPVPGDSDSCVPTALFDRQLPTYLGLPAMPAGSGQVVVTAGDVLLRFDPNEAVFAAAGITGLGCSSTPEEAAGHGIFCCTDDDRLRRFLQKASPAEQAAEGAIDAYGRVVLDIGVTNLDAASATAMLMAFGSNCAADGRFHQAEPWNLAIHEHGLDFYREICCALGLWHRQEDRSQAQNTAPEALPAYMAAVRHAGSAWSDQLLASLFDGIRDLPFRVHVLPRCGFLHFGTSAQVIEGGQALVQFDRGTAPLAGLLDITNRPASGERIIGGNSWVEGCRIGANLTLGGKNLVVGADIESPTSFPAGACLDIAPGRDEGGRSVWFVRCYGVNDTFKSRVSEGATFCGRPIMEWLFAVGADSAQVWDDAVPPGERTLWNGRVFVADTDPGSWPRWAWMFEPQQATADQKYSWREARRYSAAQIAALADPSAFLRRRLEIRAEQVGFSLRRTFRPDSQFSASDLVFILRNTSDRTKWVADLLAEAQWYHDGAARSSHGLESLVFPRIAHTLGSALEHSSINPDELVLEALPGLATMLTPGHQGWMSSVGVDFEAQTTVREWSARLRAAAFGGFGQTILASGGKPPPPPRQALRSDEIVWGRAPARLDSAGGWSDTPPYSLENGGCVVNTAINLNGQPPIQAYARVIERPVIRIGSIDLGVTVNIDDLATLLDYRRPDSEFALAKAALALSGFSPDAAAWPAGITLAEMLHQFGGGIELTTLAAIPKGSGLGTSSIMGAVTLAVIQRVMGRTLSGRELFHGVLRLEQALTTGGGWQDQIGGSVGGAKIIRTRPGLVPDAAIHYLLADVLDPKLNGGTTLLYYTGITRLAKNILEQVVGRYLDRNRHSMATLRRIHELAPGMADALSRKDLAEFGRLTTVAWELNKQLDPNSTNAEVDALMARVQPHLHGAKLIGAGGGGFMLMVCRSPEDAACIRRDLDASPPNPRARFFEFGVNPDGLVVTVC